jgi:hypothetical protein
MITPILKFSFWLRPFGAPIQRLGSYKIKLFDVNKKFDTSKKVMQLWHQGHISGDATRVCVGSF